MSSALPKEEEQQPEQKQPEQQEQQKPSEIKGTTTTTITETTTETTTTTTTSDPQDDDPSSSFQESTGAPKNKKPSVAKTNETTVGTNTSSETRRKEEKEKEANTTNNKNNDDKTTPLTSNNNNNVDDNDEDDTQKKKKKKQQQEEIATIHRRRSKRVLHQDPIIAPGYGTKKDLLRLTQDLCWSTANNNHNNSLPYEAVEAIMKSRGRGIRSSTRNQQHQEGGVSTNNNNNTGSAAVAATPISSAWADFMKEEGVMDGGGGDGGSSKKRKTTDTASTTGSTRTSSRRSASKEDDDKNNNNTQETSKPAAATIVIASAGDVDHDTGIRTYSLPSVWEELEAISNNNNTSSSSSSSGRSKKKPATSSSASTTTTVRRGGVLLQAGTLDANLVGRSKSVWSGGGGGGTTATTTTGKSSLQQQEMEIPIYHCPIPTRLLVQIQISQVFTSCNAVHSFALATNGKTYGWGRNECHQLGNLVSSSSSSRHSGGGGDDDDDNENRNNNNNKEVPKNVYVPTEIALPAPLRMAAVGKSHSLFLLQDNTLYSVGANKSGQCSVRNYHEIIPNLRKCILPDHVILAQIACGEDFSMAISTKGHLYSCGCSQYGQLGTGETGEYFVTANKLAYSNANIFERRQTFCYAPNEKLHTTSEVAAKVIPIPNCNEILIEQVTCGKHHTLLVEATSEARARVFSFGCGDYGCLGHGAQKDEYYPRMIGVVAKLPLGQMSSSLSSSSSSGDDDPSAPLFTVMAGAHCSLLRTNTSGHVYYWGKHRSVGEAVMRPQLVDVLANNQHVVTKAAAGGQTVICSTSLAQTVAWGQGPHGELGLGTAKKSSAKPTFVESLNGIQVLDLAAGYGHTLFVVDPKITTTTESLLSSIEELPQVDQDDVEGLVVDVVVEEKKKKKK